MRLRIYLTFYLFLFIFTSANADIMTELAKRDRRNTINIGNSFDSFSIYSENGYLITSIFSDGMDKASIVAYQIQENNIKLIIRIKTWDFAFRIYDYLFEKDGIDEFTVIVHNYYLVELVYINEKLETYCNRIRDINTNEFIFNEARISGNVNAVSDYYLTYPRLDMDLTEGTAVKIAALINERTNELDTNTYTFDTFDYYYHILIDDQQVRINGYLLDFGSKIDYRAAYLTFKSGNTPQTVLPEDSPDYIGKWRYTGTGGLGFNERTIIITVSERELHHYYKGPYVEYEYTLTDIMWTRLIRPDEDFQRYVEMLDDDFKGASGFIVTGTIINRKGGWTPDVNTTTEYIYLRPDNKNRLLWYNYYASNHELIRIN